MSKQIPLGDEARAAETEVGGLHVVASDIACQRLWIVNVVYVGEAGAGEGEWVLIDAGVPGTAGFNGNASYPPPDPKVAYRAA